MGYGVCVSTKAMCFVTTGRPAADQLKQIPIAAVVLLRSRRMHVYFYSVV